MKDKKVAAVDLKPKDFPVTIRFYDDDTDELLETLYVESPGVLDIKSYAPRRTRVEVTFGKDQIRTEVAHPPEV